jgi:perosamine synthetase
MIPLSIPNLSDAERDAVAETVSGGWVSSAGPDIKRFEEEVAKYCGVRFGVALSSGTAALHLALMVAGVEKGDLVLASNLTFVASVNAISYLGASPVLVDVDPATLQMDAGLVADFLENETDFREGKCYHRESGKRIAALLPVHVMGYSPDMERLNDLARERGIAVVEDAAEALGSRFGGRHAGSTGLLGTLSFNGNKILTTGGGGMVLTNDPHLADEVRHLSTQAKSFSAEYIHDRVGYNYRMPNLNAAMGIAQLGRLDGFLARKREIYAFYTEAFKGIPDIRQIQFDADKGTSNHWLHTIFHPRARQLEEYLNMFDIQTRKLWVPMNRLPMYRGCRYLFADDHSHACYEQSLTLPSSSGITDAELAEVAEKVMGFFAD